MSGFRNRFGVAVMLLAAMVLAEVTRGAFPAPTGGPPDVRWMDALERDIRAEVNGRASIFSAVNVTTHALPCSTVFADDTNSSVQLTVDVSHGTPIVYEIADCVAVNSSLSVFIGIAGSVGPRGPPAVMVVVRNVTVDGMPEGFEVVVPTAMVVPPSASGGDLPSACRLVAVDELPSVTLRVEHSTLIGSEVVASVSGWAANASSWPVPPSVARLQCWAPIAIDIFQSTIIATGGVIASSATVLARAIPGVAALSKASVTVFASTVSSRISTPGDSSTGLTALSTAAAIAVDSRVVNLVSKNELSKLTGSLAVDGVTLFCSDVTQIAIVSQPVAAVAALGIAVTTQFASLLVAALSNARLGCSGLSNVSMTIAPLSRQDTSSSMAVVGVAVSARLPTHVRLSWLSAWITAGSNVSLQLLSGSDSDSAIAVVGFASRQGSRTLIPTYNVTDMRLALTRQSSVVLESVVPGGSNSAVAIAGLAFCGAPPVAVVTNVASSVLYGSVCSMRFAATGFIGVSDAAVCGGVVIVAERYDMIITNAVLLMMNGVTCVVRSNGFHGGACSGCAGVGALVRSSPMNKMRVTGLIMRIANGTNVDVSVSAIDSSAAFAAAVVHVSVGHALVQLHDVQLIIAGPKSVVSVAAVAGFGSAGAASIHVQSQNNASLLVVNATCHVALGATVSALLPRIYVGDGMSIASVASIMVLSSWTGTGLMTSLVLETASAVVAGNCSVTVAVVGWAVRSVAAVASAGAYGRGGTVAADLTDLTAMVSNGTRSSISFTSQWGMEMQGVGAVASAVAFCLGFKKLATDGTVLSLRGVNTFAALDATIAVQNLARGAVGEGLIAVASAASFLLLFPLHTVLNQSLIAVDGSVACLVGSRSTVFIDVLSSRCTATFGSVLSTGSIAGVVTDAAMTMCMSNATITYQGMNPQNPLLPLSCAAWACDGSNISVGTPPFNVSGVMTEDVAIVGIPDATCAPERPTTSVVPATCNVAQNVNLSSSQAWGQWCFLSVAALRVLEGALTPVLTAERRPPTQSATLSVSDPSVTIAFTASATSSRSRSKRHRNNTTRTMRADSRATVTRTTGMGPRSNATSIGPTPITTKMALPSLPPPTSRAAQRRNVTRTVTGRRVQQPHMESAPSFVLSARVQPAVVATASVATTGAAIVMPAAASRPSRLRAVATLGQCRADDDAAAPDYTALPLQMRLLGTTNESMWVGSVLLNASMTLVLSLVCVAVTRRWKDRRTRVTITSVSAAMFMAYMGPTIVGASTTLAAHGSSGAVIGVAIGSGVTAMAIPLCWLWSTLSELQAMRKPTASSP